MLFNLIKRPDEDQRYKEGASLTDTCKTCHYHDHDSSFNCFRTMTAAVMVQYRRSISWGAALKLTHENNYRREGRRGKVLLLAPSPSLFISPAVFLCCASIERLVVGLMLMQRWYNSLRLPCYTAVVPNPLITNQAFALLWWWHRQMIMSGCAAFAQVVGSTRIEAELLPQWWEQVRGINCHIEYQDFHKRAFSL